MPWLTSFIFNMCFGSHKIAAIYIFFVLHLTDGCPCIRVVDGLFKTSHDGAEGWLLNRTHLSFVLNASLCQFQNNAGIWHRGSIFDKPVNTRGNGIQYFEV